MVKMTAASARFIGRVLETIRRPRRETALWFVGGLADGLWYRDAQSDRGAARRRREASTRRAGLLPAAGADVARPHPPRPVVVPAARARPVRRLRDRPADPR